MKIIKPRRIPQKDEIVLKDEIILRYGIKSEPMQIIIFFIFGSIFVIAIGGIFFLVICYAICYYVWFCRDERIILDKENGIAIVEKRTFADKKFGWKEAKEIKFSDIKEVRIIEVVGDFADNSWVINLITIGGDSINISTESNSNRAKEVGVKLCKIIGISEPISIDLKTEPEPIKASNERWQW